MPVVHLTFITYERKVYQFSYNHKVITFTHYNYKVIIFATYNLAAEHGTLSSIDTLIKAGAFINATGPLDLTPLHLVASEGRIDAVEMLLEAKADVNAESGGVTPLLKAVFRGQSLVTQILIEAGADVECRDTFGNTPLSTSLMTVLGKPEVNAETSHNRLAKLCIRTPTNPTITQILLLRGNASIKKIDRFPIKAQNLLKTWGFDYRTFDVVFNTSKELGQKHSSALIDILTRDARMPTVIAVCIVKYHDCIETRVLLFKHAQLSYENDEFIMKDTARYMAT
jgi:hypothetical protein